MCMCTCVRVRVRVYVCVRARARASMHTFVSVYKHVEEETNGADIDAV